MSKKSPNDPIQKYQRKAKAVRRIGDQSCKCGENRPEALIAGTVPIICAACERKRLGQSTLDAHHPAGKANHPATVTVPVNDHRAILSNSQYDWPPETWENPRGSPLLAGAASIRGFSETNTYLTNELLIWIARMLEALDECLKKRLGQNWWVGTKLEQFAPKR
jgi:hypothetical protein